MIYDETTESVKFDSVEGPSEYLPDLIQYDKRFGKLPLPTNGIVTYKIYGTPPRGMTEKSLERSFRLGLQRIMLSTIDIKHVRRAVSGETPTFKVYIRGLAEDSNLTRNTIMYAYYPLNSLTNGVIVVNRDGFFYTLHGNGVSMYVIAPQHYPENTTAKGSTIDMDTVFAHELKHSLGLPHDPKQGNNMSANYSYIAEHDTPRDTSRVQAKYRKRSLAQRFKDRFMAAFRIISDR